MLANADLSALDPNRVQFFTSPQALKLFIASRFRRKGGLMVVMPPAYRRLYPTLVSELEPELIEATGLAGINTNTCNSRAREWVHNMVRNWERAAECPNVQVLALGDSPNDESLLRAGDISVVVPGPSGPHPHFADDIAHGRLKLAPAPHASGWACSVLTAVKARVSAKLAATAPEPPLDWP